MRNHSDEVSSPGQGTTAAPLSVEPLATEGEATPGPDDVNPFDDQELTQALLQERSVDEDDISKDRDPTAGDDDPFVFDDIGDGLQQGVELPSLDDIGSGPMF